MVGILEKVKINYVADALERIVLDKLNKLEKLNRLEPEKRERIWRTLSNILSSQKGEYKNFPSIFRTLEKQEAALGNPESFELAIKEEITIELKLLENTPQRDKIKEKLREKYGHLINNQTGFYSN